MRTSLVAALVSLLLWPPGGIRAQETQRLSLEEAVGLGLKESHRLAQVGAQRESALAGADALHASQRPIVSLQASYIRTNHVPSFGLPDPASGQVVILYPDIPDNARARLGLQWPIYTGGRSGALERAARAEADAIGQDLAAAHAELRLEITRVFWAVVTADAAVVVLEQALARMDAHLNDARALLEAGLIPRSDVLSSESRRSRELMLLIEARNLGESSRVDLRRLVGLAPAAPVALAAALTPPPPPVAAAESLVAQARTERPERRGFESRVHSADERQAAAEAGRRPSITVVGGYDYSRPNDRYFPRADEWKASWELGVLLNWPLWDAGRTRAEVAKAAADRRVVQEGFRDFDATLESDVRKRRLDLDSALAAVAAADDSVRTATEARRVVTARYAAGLASNIEALDAQQQLLQAELDRTRAIASARLAAARLEWAVGH